MDRIALSIHCPLAANVQRLHQEAEVETQKTERQKENLLTKLAQLEKDMQLQLKTEQNAHEEDVERLTKERVSYRCQFQPVVTSSL